MLETLEVFACVYPILPGIAFFVEKCRALSPTAKGKG
jgi:hypothetical protein